MPGLSLRSALQCIDGTVPPACERYKFLQFSSRISWTFWWYVSSLYCILLFKRTVTFNTHYFFVKQAFANVMHPLNYLAEEQVFFSPKMYFWCVFFNVYFSHSHRCDLEDKAQKALVEGPSTQQPINPPLLSQCQAIIVLCKFKSSGFFTNWTLCVTKQTTSTWVIFFVPSVENLDEQIWYLESIKGRSCIASDQG